MILPNVEIVARDLNNYTVQTAWINGVKYPVEYPSNNLRGVIFYKNTIVKFDDCDDLNQNHTEFDRWQNMKIHPDFKQDKKHFAEILYFSPHCEYLIQRRYKFVSDLPCKIRAKYFEKVQMLAKKYRLGQDYNYSMHNWGVTKVGILKIFDFGAW